jgi:hypothetical protein
VAKILVRDQSHLLAFDGPRKWHAGDLLLARLQFVLFIKAHFNGAESFGRQPRSHSNGLANAKYGLS